MRKLLIPLAVLVGVLSFAGCSNGLSSEEEAFRQRMLSWWVTYGEAPAFALESEQIAPLHEAKLLLRLALLRGSDTWNLPRWAGSASSQKKNLNALMTLRLEGSYVNLARTEQMASKGIIAPQVGYRYPYLPGDYFDSYVWGVGSDYSLYGFSAFEHAEAMLLSEISDMWDDARAYWSKTLGCGGYDFVECTGVQREW